MISFQFLATAFVVVIIPGIRVLYTLALGLGQGRHAAVTAVFAALAGRLALERA